MTLQAIRYDRENYKLEILDQLLIPYETKYVPIATIEDAFYAIQQMKVRGAPAIAIVGAFAVVVDTFNAINSGSAPSKEEFNASLDQLISSRPTAVNLSNALNDLRQLTASATTIGPNELEKITEYAERLYEDDLANNYKIGDNGTSYIVNSLKTEGFEGPFSILTVCNTGSLATSGHGTALGIIRTAYSNLQEKTSEYPFHLEQVFPCETRPYNQGARLTAYELDYENIPFTLICDNMVSALIRDQNSRAPVKFIIVGADRIVNNGDAANKIGTYQLATIANYYNQRGNEIKFIVAAPRTTIDFKTSQGDDIVIEQRPADELTTLTGPLLKNDGTVGAKHKVGIAPPGIEVWNPSFDVTPHDLIDAIVTEDPNVYTKENGAFKLN
ncbi:methylthioribose-1-phosphate isomerase [Diutina catenulata]